MLEAELVTVNTTEGAAYGAAILASAGAHAQQQNPGSVTNEGDQRIYIPLRSGETAANWAERFAAGRINRSIDAGRDYSVEYAVAESPLGPFVKAAHNPILSSLNAEISGPGHNAVTTSPDRSELFIVYHIHTDPQNLSGDRQICIDRMGFREDGSLYVHGPIDTPQPIPSAKE